nr:MAG TPA: hypothetical protein [Caudoviricetes sp.]
MSRLLGKLSISIKRRIASEPFLVHTKNITS